MQVYMLKAEGIAFRFLPDPLQIKNALEVCFFMNFEAHCSILLSELGLSDLSIVSSPLPCSPIMTKVELSSSDRPQLLKASIMPLYLPQLEQNILYLCYSLIIIFSDINCRKRMEHVCLSLHNVLLTDFNIDFLEYYWHTMD